MLFLKKNKKGIFFPLFVVAVTIILASLAVIINHEQAKKENLVGLRAVNILKLSDESEKIMYFYDLASKHSTKKSIVILGENGGYSADNRCEKTQPTLINQNQYIIWNTCPVLNPHKEFELQFKKEMEIFSVMYESTYINTDYKKLFDMENIEKEDYNAIYTSNVKNSKIIGFDNIAENKILRMSEIVLPVEGSQESFVILKPEIKVKNFNSEHYTQLYNAVNNKCIHKQFEECRQSLTEEFNELSINIEGDLIKLEIPVDDYIIKVAFDNKYQLPAYFESGNV